MSKWIPCSKRMPNKEGVYLVSTPNGKEKVDLNYWRGGGWYLFQGRITAWMPLPEPYEEERKHGQKKGGKNERSDLQTGGD